jgi:16S rRNA processing protein RimM
MKALPLSEEFHLIRPETDISVQIEGGIRQCMVKSLRRLNKHFIISLHGVTDRDDAATYRGALLSCPSHVTALRDGEFLYEQIIGLDVFNSLGDRIGRVVDIFNNGAHDVYVASGVRNEYLIPAVREFVREILPDENKIIVDDIIGLFD